MKTSIDIPEQCLAEAMRYTGAKTKREAVVKAMEEYNRQQKVEAFLKMAGTCPDFPSNDELEADDLRHNEHMTKEWKKK